MKVLVETGFVKKDSRFREKGSQTYNLYALQYQLIVLMRKRLNESEEQEAELNEVEMEIVSFEDYKKEEKITGNILDSSANFMKADIVKNQFTLNIETVNHKCHG
ncbi:hypothetical protein KPL47_22590 [Clostridium estertheticum]|uniref:hypothetical protein n=1 Tax=Clostridium estertheticum TaxID=238834 RepID=UPI001C0B095F|nr:hypothetical protein [Clostridium estertheticum]MBU3179088.1 hypothetical protein [Clostridium estertheticum]